ncbi:MAG TPA: methyltransferase domain-containing protein [Candidatus Angelobacter sp.]|nr:methyltransferase domain-containing protein [Candidatus Angelobacter sp.]
MQTTDQNTRAETPAIPNLAAIRAKQKATWESGDFGKIARHIENVAEEFLSRQPLQPGQKVLDVACGTGNLAVIAARRGCAVSGADIAANLLAQARARATADGLNIDFKEADAEALPFANDTFDLAVSMFGVMFAPQPSSAVAELQRVLKRGGRMALANWTPEGFIGKMFVIFRKHLPPPPAGVALPMEWGKEAVVRERLKQGFADVQLTRRMAVMRFPFSPAETVEFFREYYGPTFRAFESLAEPAREALRRDLVELQTRYNDAKVQGATEVAAEYLEVIATKV